MKRFQVLSHTADVRIKVEGDSLGALFTVGLEAINSLLNQKGCQGKEAFPLKESLSLVANDTTSLFIDFLSEVVSRSYANRALYCKVIFTDLTPVSLQAHLAGIPVRGFDEDIKAVTYHEADIVKNAKGLYQTTIVLDI